MLSAGPVCSCAPLRTLLHTRPRVQRAPGFPCALSPEGNGKLLAKLGRNAPREREGVSGENDGRERAKVTVVISAFTAVIPAKAGIPLRRRFSLISPTPRNTGSPAGACHLAAIRPTRWRVM